MVAAKGKTAAPRKKAAKTVKSSPSHPPYIEMAKEAILTLKERAGSSHYAIAKFIEEKQGGRLPPNFKKLLFVQLKRFVAGGKLVKVKNSFKVPSGTTTPKPASSSATSVAAKVLKRKAGATVKARPAKALKTAAASKKAVAPTKPKRVPAKAAAKKPKSLKSPGKRVSRS